jgi:hypothetical protein
LTLEAIMGFARALFRGVLTVTIAFVFSACATPPRERDDLCDELVRFADAPSGVDRHSVRLKTDWGGVYLKSAEDEPGEQVMAAKSCEHGSDEPGKALCAYLIEHSATEFATINYRRVLECLGVHVKAARSAEDAGLPRLAKSRRVRGHVIHSEIVAEFSYATDSEPPTLTISATK